MSKVLLKLNDPFHLKSKTPKSNQIHDLWIVIWLSMLLSILPELAFAQGTGLLDTSFASTDMGFSIGNGPNNFIQASAEQPDGKLIIGGQFTKYNNTSSSKIIRLDTNGRVDNTFMVSNSLGGRIVSLAVQNDGKILAGGSFGSKLIRFNANGSRDNSFSVSSISTQYSEVFDIRVQPDGKIIAVGDFYNLGGNQITGIVRLNSDGSLDTSFHPGSGPNNHVYCVHLQNDGKIVIGGVFSSYNGAPSPSVARLNSNGSLDTSFHVGNGFNGFVYGIDEQSNGNLVFAGTFKTYDNDSTNHLARLYPNGTLDTTITGSFSSNHVAWDVKVQSDDKVVAAGGFTKAGGVNHHLIARFNPNGTIDNTFESSMIPFSTNMIEDVTILANGKLFLEGFFKWIKNGRINYCSRLQSDGKLDKTFNIQTGVDKRVRRIEMQSNNQIIIGGEFYMVNNYFYNHLARLDSNGKVDTTFKIGTGFSSNVLDIAVQDDDKILVCGKFNSFNGRAAKYIVRLNPNGSIDTTFKSGLGFNDQCSVLKLMPNGKILVGGSFSSYNGKTVNGLVRLHSNGDRDSTLNIGQGFNQTVGALAVQSDGKIIVGGSFSHYNGAVKKYLVRIDSTGNLDQAFDTGIGAGPNSGIHEITVLSNGKIVIGGSFFQFNNKIHNRLIRLLPNGITDTTFLIGQGSSYDIYSIKEIDNDQILIAGAFTQINTTLVKRIAKLNKDGSIDKTFDIGNDPLGGIWDTEYLPNGKIIIAGDFTSVNTIGRNRVARLNACNSILVNDTIEACDSYTWIDGNTYYQSVNNVLFSKPTVHGCDSIFSLSLIIDTLQAHVVRSNDTLRAFPLDGTVKWFSCDSNQVLPNPNSHYFIPAVNGNYAAIIERGSCTDTTQCINVNDISLLENELHELRIYPNPTSRYINVESSIGIDEIKVLDPTGRVVLSSTKQTSIDLGELSNGVYFVLVEIGNTVATRRIIKL